MKKFLLTTLLVLWVTDTVFAGQWIQNGDAWMYQDDNGDFISNEQKRIDGKYYYFDGDGCLLTGYQAIDGSFYVFNSDGTPKTESILFDGVTYNVNAKGKISNMNDTVFEKLQESAFVTGTGALAGELANVKTLLDTFPISKKALRSILVNKGVTSDKVEYLVANSNVDWKKQAAKCAKKYLEYRNYNRKSLIAILEVEGFTADEARHGADSALALDTNGIDVNENDRNQDIAKYIAEMQTLSAQIYWWNP